MPWINNRMERPLKEGKYKCLIDIDSFGTLVEYDNQYFDGIDWSHTESARQFITHWWADKEEYDIIFDIWVSECLKECEKSKELGYLD